MLQCELNDLYCCSEKPRYRMPCVAMAEYYILPSFWRVLTFEKIFKKKHCDYILVGLVNYKTKR